MALTQSTRISLVKWRLTFVSPWSMRKQQFVMAITFATIRPCDQLDSGDQWVLEETKHVNCSHSPWFESLCIFHEWRLPMNYCSYAVKAKIKRLQNLFETSIDETELRASADSPVALVTGASRGIGAATASELARKGYRLVLAARSAHDLRELAGKLDAAGSICHIVPTDLRRKEDLKQLARAALEQFAGVDVLIHNAGVALPRRWAANLTDENVSEVIETNLLAPIELTRQLLPSMIERRSGFIGFIDSIGGHIPFPAAALYTTTKFALRGFAGALRREVMEHGIKVSIISPGFVSTRLTEEVREVVQKLYLPMISAEGVARVIVRTIERPRREVIYPGYYHVFAWLERNLPGVMDRVLSSVLPILKEREAEPVSDGGRPKKFAARPAAC